MRAIFPGAIMLVQKSSKILFMLITCLSLGAAESIVAHPSTQIANMNESEFNYYFTGKKTTWPDGSRVIVVIVTGSKSHEKLMTQLGKNEYQFMSGWKKLVFTGRGSMPLSTKSEEELVALIEKTPGAIGYVDAEKVSGSVKVIPIR